MIFELAYGARPELFKPSRRDSRGRKQYTMPINAGTITSLKAILHMKCFQHADQGEIQDATEADRQAQGQASLASEEGDGQDA